MVEDKEKDVSDVIQKAWEQSSFRGSEGMQKPKRAASVGGRSSRNVEDVDRFSSGEGPSTERPSSGRSKRVQEPERASSVGGRSSRNVEDVDRFSSGEGPSAERLSSERVQEPERTSSVGGRSSRSSEDIDRFSSGEGPSAERLSSERVQEPERTSSGMGVSSRSSRDIEEWGTESSQEVMRTLIPKKRLLPLTKREITKEIAKDPVVRQSQKEVEQMSRIVYGASQALNDHLEQINWDPALGEELSQKISRSPKSVGKVAGSLLSREGRQARREARESVSDLSDAINAYVASVKLSEEKIRHQHNVERLRCMQEVAAPSEKLRDVLSMSKKEQRESLLASFALREELDNFVHRVDARFSLSDNKAVRDDDFDRLSESLGIPEGRARHVAGLVKQARVAYHRVQAVKELEHVLIPSKDIPPLTRVELSRKISGDVLVQASQKDVEHLCEIVYGLPKALDRRLARVNLDPESGEQLAEQIANTPGAVARLAGIEIWGVQGGIRNSERKQAENHVAQLSAAVRAYVEVIEDAEETAILEHAAEQRRSRRMVAMPSKELRNALSEPKSAQILLTSPKLREELDGFVQEIDARLSVQERKAAECGDYKQLAANLGTSGVKAREISRLVGQARESYRKIQEIEEFGQVLIPASRMEFLEEEEISRKLAESPSVREKYREVEVLSRRVFGRSTVLHEYLEKINRDPDVGIKLASQVLRTPESIYQFAGRHLWGVGDKEFYQAVNALPALARTITAYTQVVRTVHQEAVTEFQEWQERGRQIVEMPSKRLLEFLSASQGGQRVLETAFAFREELEEFVNKIDVRLTPGERRAIRSDDCEAFSKSLGVSLGRAREIMDLIKQAEEIFQKVQELEELEQIFIPGRSVPRMTEDQLRAEVSRDSTILQVRGEIERLSEIVYGDSEILSTHLERINLDPDLGVEISKQVESDPKSVYALVGSGSLRIRNVARDQARKTAPELGAAILDYTKTAKLVVEELTQRRDEAQRRCLKAVEMPSGELRSVLSMSKDMQKGVLALSPVLQEELEDFVKKIDVRLLSSDHAAIRSDDYDRLSESLGISLSKAQEIADIVRQAKVVHHRMQAVWELEAVCIPSKSLPPLQEEKVLEGVLGSAAVQRARKEIDRLSQIVYGRSDVLSKHLEGVNTEPALGEDLVEQINRYPQSVSKLVGFKISSRLGTLRSWSRQRAEQHLVDLSDAVRHYVDTVGAVETEMFRAYKEEQERCERVVKMPSVALQDIFALPRDRHRDALESAPALQEELCNFMDKVNKRLSLSERTALENGDYDTLSEGFGISTSRAQDVVDLLQKAKEIHLKARELRELRDICIPSKSLPSLQKEDVLEKVMEDSSVQQAREKVEHLSKMLYGDPHALRERLEQINRDPTLGEELAKEIAHSPQSISKILGGGISLVNVRIRRQTRESASSLSAALVDYAEAIKSVGEKVYQEYDEERMRSSREVAMPSQELKDILFMRKSAQREALESSYVLQDELCDFMDKVTDRLSPSEYTAITSKDYAGVSESLGVSEDKAKDIVALIKRAIEVRKHAQDLKEHRHIFIPSQNIRSVTKEEVFGRVLDDLFVQQAQKEVEYLSKVVYGNEAALKEQLEQVGARPELAQEVAQKIKDSPESIGKLAGLGALGVSNQTRQLAKENVFALSAAIIDYADSIKALEERMRRERDVEQERYTRAVEMPSAKLKDLLAMPKDVQQEALETSSILRRELGDFVNKINNRLSPTEHEAIRRNDHYKLSESFGASQSHAKDILDFIKQAREAYQQVRELDQGHIQTMARAV